MEQPSFDTPFQPLTEEHHAWLNQWHRVGAKELKVEALLGCINLVVPATTISGRGPLSETEAEENLQRWYGVCYSGTTFKAPIDHNIQTAIQIHVRCRETGADRQLRAVADAFLRAAVQEYDRLIAGGQPDSMTYWRRILDGTDEPEA